MKGKPFIPRQLPQSVDRDSTRVKPELANLAASFWHIENRGTEVKTYHVVPDGCVDLIGSASSFNGIFISPTPSEPVRFDIEPGSVWFGMRLLPGIFHRLTGISVGELEGQTLIAEDVERQLFAGLNDKLSSTDKHGDRQKAMADWLIKTADVNADTKSETTPFDRAIDGIIKRGGDVRVDSEVEAGISSRQLRRLFYHRVGMSPKKFARVVRFQNAVGRILAASGDSMTDAFFDQAHFIKEVKTLAGFTPGDIKKGI